MYHVTRSLSSVLSPILPHLSHELSLSARVLPRVMCSGWYCDTSLWSRDTDLAHVLTSLETVREQLNKMTDIKVGDSEVVVGVTEKVYNMLTQVDRCQVAEVLGVVSVELVSGDQDKVSF